MTDATSHRLDDLLGIVARLRDPVSGCAWDIKQDFASVAPHTLEEAYEVVDAIDRGNWNDLREELGDLLLQVVFHAQIAKEAGLFDFADVAHAISAKMRRRHPHVFSTTRFADDAARRRAWEDIKASERAERGEPVDTSALAGVSPGLPEWQRALKLQQRAAMAGFDWATAAPVLNKLEEEVAEVRAVFVAGADAARLEDEIGDVLFVMVNLARLGKVDFSGALRHANTKFERRFRQMEQFADADGDVFAEATLAEQEALWQRVKATERQ